MIASEAARLWSDLRPIVGLAVAVAGGIVVAAGAMAFAGLAGRSRRRWP